MYTVLRRLLRIELVVIFLFLPLILNANQTRTKENWIGDDHEHYQHNRRRLEVAEMYHQFPVEHVRFLCFPHKDGTQSFRTG
jgi:hypothetical protein